MAAADAGRLGIEIAVAATAPTAVQPPIPNRPVLAGLTLSAQALVLPGAVPSSWHLTNLVQRTISR